MSSSLPPEILSPAISPVTSLPPPEPIASPFLSPLPPSPPEAVPAPSLPPAIPPPPAETPIPPEIPISPPPPVLILSPPPPVPILFPPPPPVPILPRPPPPPPEEVAPDSPPPTESVAVSPPSPELSSPPAPSEPPPESPLPPDSESPPPEFSLPPPAISAPPPETSTSTVPFPDSGTPRLPESVSPPATAMGTLPAAVQIRKAGTNVKVSPGFIAGSVVVSLVVFLVVFFACVFCFKRRRRSRKCVGLPQHYLIKPASSKSKDNFSTVARSTTRDNSDSRSSQGVFAYGQLAEATGWFSEANVVGEGGFGSVYKGVLARGAEVAVKRLRTGSHQGEREFRAEVDIIARIHHKHLVSLLGYCITGHERLLVYEFAPNNTLEFHLHEDHQRVLEWPTRLKIAIGSAKGLAYLHEDCNPKIIHRDIKASNILLDLRFEAKVSDFGLAKSFSDTSTHISTRVVGTFGYLAPEYASSGKVTEKSDVYSYGVVLLELITGRTPICSTDPIRNQGLVEWARQLLTQAMDDRYFDNLVDPRLGRNYDEYEMHRMVSCAAACVRHSAWLRPKMSQIVHALEGHAALTDLHEGIAPGNSTLFTSPGSSYNAHEYRNDMNKFHMTIADQEYG